MKCTILEAGNKYSPYRQLPSIEEQEQNLQEQKPFHWSQVTENGEIGMRIFELQKGVSDERK